MQKIAFPTRALAILLAFGAVLSGEVRGAALKEASITEAFNTVSYQSSAAAPQRVAGVGTNVYPDNIVRTGVKSRAELQFNDKTITRIGANSAFSFDAENQSMNLREGTALFSKPKDSSPFEITTPAATCSISGTTGFMEVRTGRDKAHPAFIFGLIEGHTRVTIAGKTYNVGPGELLVRTGTGSVNFLSFNIPKFMAKAGLVKDFKSRLPNQIYINKAVADFDSLEERGFIIPSNISIAAGQEVIGFYASAAGENHPYNGSNDQFNLDRQVTAFQGQVAQTGMMESATSSGGGSTGGGGFVNVGGTGTIHGQLIWNVDVDLDLHLILPNNAGEVFYANRTISFNNSTATATLDHDNLGGTIDVPPTQRVENITVTGTLPTGGYQFYVHDYNSYGATAPTAYTLTTTGNGGTTQQVQSGTLSGTGVNGATVTVNH